MDTTRNRSAINGAAGAMEENTMVILDGFGRTDTLHLHNDRILFLDAVRFASIVPENGNPPTNKMWQAIIRILREGKSMELIIGSYHLLIELEKRFPRVYMKMLDERELASSKRVDLIVIEEAWSPFDLSGEIGSNEKHAAVSKHNARLDPAGFATLLENLAEASIDTEYRSKLLQDMLLFQYLVNVLEGDYRPRNRTFADTQEWNLLRESLLNRLLGSRKINYKDLVKISLSILSTSGAAYSQGSDSRSHTVSTGDASATALLLALPEAERCTRRAAQNLLVMMMELDSLRKKAEMQGLTTRADAVRTPALEIILDELMYNKHFLAPFFEVFDEPKLKLEVILKYFGKYSGKPSVRTRRGSGATHDATISRFLMSLSNSKESRTLIKKIGSEVLQLLIAHVLQACISLPNDELFGVTADLDEGAETHTVEEICRNVISAFIKMRELNNCGIELAWCATDE
ncbi:Negative regulator of systemic acquired resistance SNI1-like protein [Drosera capensis]